MTTDNCRTCGRLSYEEHSSEATSRCEGLERLAWAIDAAELLEVLAALADRVEPWPGMRSSLLPLTRWAHEMRLQTTERPRLACERGSCA